MANILGVMGTKDYGQYAWGGPQAGLTGGAQGSLGLESAGLGNVNTNNSDNSRDWNYGQGYLNNDMSGGVDPQTILDLSVGDRQDFTQDELSLYDLNNDGTIDSGDAILARQGNSAGNPVASPGGQGVAYAPQGQLAPSSAQPRTDADVGGNVMPGRADDGVSPAIVGPEGQVATADSGVLAPDIVQGRTDADVGGNAIPGYTPEYTPGDAPYEPPQYTSPELEALPEFTGPQYDDSRVAERAQGLASTSVRRMGQSVRQALSGDIENPNARRMVQRGALSGYSQGLEDVTAASRNQAYAEYDQDYAREFNTAERNYGTDLLGVQTRNAAKTQEAQMNFQRDLSTYNMDWQQEQDTAMINAITEQNENIANHLAALKEYYDSQEQTTIITEGEG